MALGRGLRRDRDGGDAARLQPEAAPKPADLRLAAADAGPLLDDPLGLLHRPWRVLAEDVFQRAAVVVEGAAPALPRGPADGVQAALDERPEVALDGRA